MDQAQWVCTVCGYNIIGERPEVCPFCGARHENFLTWQEAERTYRVTAEPVCEGVSQLLSVPRLGLEHAAYRVEHDDGAFWIDCPSAFNRDLAPVEAIYFTHKDFLGASNQYRALWSAKVHLHGADAAHPLAAPFSIDVHFTGNFTAPGLEAIHIGGHTPGFTMYIHGSVLFACDYAFPPGPQMRLNPFGPQEATRSRAQWVLRLIDERPLETVCGYNYVTDFEGWRRDFARASAD